MMKKTIFTLSLFTISLGMMSCDLTGPGRYEYGLHVGTFVSNSNDDYILSYGTMTIEEITKEEYDSLEFANSVAELESSNTVRAYYSLAFSLYNSETSRFVSVTLSHIEHYQSRKNVYTGNIRVNDGVNEIKRFFYELSSDYMSLTFEYHESSLVYRFDWSNILESL